MQISSNRWDWKPVLKFNLLVNNLSLNVKKKTTTETRNSKSRVKSTLFTLWGLCTNHHSLYSYKRPHLIFFLKDKKAPTRIQLWLYFHTPFPVRRTHQKLSAGWMVIRTTEGALTLHLSVITELNIHSQLLHVLFWNPRQMVEVCFTRHDDVNTWYDNTSGNVNDVTSRSLFMDV